MGFYGYEYFCKHQVLEDTHVGGLPHFLLLSPLKHLPTTWSSSQHHFVLLFWVSQRL